MKKIILLFVLISIAISVNSQLVMKLEVTEDIEGICNKDEVYALFPNFEGQEKAIYPISKEKLLEKLNSELEYLKVKKKIRAKVVVHLIINCKGEVIQCSMNKTSGKKILDEQIIKLFKSLGRWKSGKLNGKAVDSSQYIYLKIRKSVVKFD